MFRCLGFCCLGFRDLGFKVSELWDLDVLGLRMGSEAPGLGLRV